MMVPEHKIQEVLERTDIVALISRHVELKKSGRSYKGRCPFHQEKSASFYVWPDGGFKCFGCQVGGDAISFVQRYLGKPFIDVVRDLAREAGVDLQTAEDPTAKERAQIKEATDLAYEHFKACLWDPEKGKKPRQYLESRGVTEEQIRAFGLGYAPEAWSELAEKLARAGLLEHGLKAGLIRPRQRGDGHYDMFRDRLIIPIRSPEGRVIAFGGRILGEGEPKYLNSPESKLYNKSDTLYAMDMARDEVRKRKQAILVEGYFDAIGMHQAGVKNAVALCSTALTPGHLSVLSRGEAKELVLLLDGDNAGRKAVERLAGPLLSAGTATKVALLPDGEDPDTFARKAGVDGTQKLLSEARPLTEYLFAALLPGGKDSSFEDKMAALDRLKPITAQLPVGLTRSAFFGALANYSGLPAAELESALKGKAPPVKPVPKPSEAQVQAAPRPQPVERPPDRLEAFYGAFLLKEPRLKAKDEFGVLDELGHPGLRRLLAQVFGGTSVEEALFDATSAVKTALQAAAKDLPKDEGQLEPAFGAVCQKLALTRINARLTEIARETSRLATASELPEEARSLMEERIRLLELKKQVHERASGPSRV
ncbi:MAG: DNA primase [Myxococcaceae bacterium]